MKSSNNAETRHYLLEAAGRIKWNIILMTLIQTVLAVFSIVSALLMRDIVNSAVAGDRELFFLNIVKFIVLAGLQLAIRAFNQYLSELTGIKLENHLKKRLFTALLDRDYGSVTTVHSGEWMNRITGDVAVVTGGVTGLIPGLVGMLVGLVGAIIVISVMDYRFLYIIIPGGILIVVLSSSFRKIMKRLHKAIRESDGKMRVFIQEAIESLLVVRSFGAEKEMAAGADERMGNYKAARMRRNRFSIFCNTGFGAVMRTATIIGAAYCGYGILTGTMSYGNFTAILSLMGQIQAPFANLSGVLPRYYAMTASAERLLEAESFPGSDSEESYSLDEIKRRYGSSLKGLGLDHISFTYLPPVQDADIQMPTVLNDISLQIKKGEYVAFVGQSGCGKSTMLKLLMCLYSPDCGERYVLTGTAEREPLDAGWRRLFAYVPQGNHLISGSIREVIAFSDKDAMRDDKRIWQALKTACADEFVSELEEGLDTQLGEHGAGLSEGQTQRIAIARAIFSDHPVLMLDECTSALDADTEKLLLERLRGMTDKTVLIVTHRPAALEICDKIVRFSQEGCEVSCAGACL